MPDEFDDLFTAFRADSMPHVRPPGVASARETVRRRRTGKMAAAAALLVVGVVGVTAGPRILGGGDPELGSAAVDAAQRPGGVTIVGQVSTQGDPAYPAVAAGDYTLTAACEGDGKLDVRAVVTAGDGKRTDLGDASLTCDPAAPRSESVRFRVPAAGDLVVTLVGDAASTGHAYYALNLKNDGNADQNAAPSDLTINNAKRAYILLLSEGLQAQSMTTEKLEATSTWQGGAGEFQMRVACVGPGSVTLRVTDGSDQVVDEKIACTSTDPESYPSFIKLDVEQGHRLGIAVVADQEASNSAGFAYAITAVG